MRNLHKVQGGRGVNAPGIPEIPEAIFEELLVNALVHRDYLVSAPIRLFIFDNRIEIISPGHLPNNLTVEKIRAGSSNTAIRSSFVTSPRVFFRTTAWVRGSKGYWRSGQISTFLMTTMAACLPPRFSGNQWRSWI